jgi:hypothetical protein
MLVATFGNGVSPGFNRVNGAGRSSPANDSQQQDGSRAARAQTRCELQGLRVGGRAGQVAEVYPEQEQQDDEHDRHKRAPPWCHGGGLPHRVGRRGSASVTDDRFVGYLGPATPALHQLDRTLPLTCTSTTRTRAQCATRPTTSRLGFRISSGRTAAIRVSTIPNVHTIVAPVGRSRTSDR